MRQLGSDIRQHDRRRGHSRMADLGPVGPGMQPVFVVLRIERGKQRIVDQPFFTQLSLFFGQLFEEPVITDRNRKSHLRHIQKMGRMPVLEPAHRLQLPDGSLRILLPPGHPVHVRQKQLPPQNLTGGLQQPDSLQTIRNRLLLQDGFTGLSDPIVNPPHPGSLLRYGPADIRLGCPAPKQPWMRRRADLLPPRHEQEEGQSQKSENPSHHRRIIRVPEPDIH